MLLCVRKCLTIIVARLFSHSYYRYKSFKHGCFPYHIMKIYDCIEQQLDLKGFIANGRLSKDLIILLTCTRLFRTGREFSILFEQMFRIFAILLSVKTTPKLNKNVACSSFSGGKTSDSCIHRLVRELEFYFLKP